MTRTSGTSETDPYLEEGVAPQAAPPAAAGTGTSDPDPTTSRATRMGGGAYLGKNPYVGALRQQHILELQDKSKKRSDMMKWTLKLATAVVIVSFVVMGSYMWSEWGELDPVVLTGWFAAVVAQTVGLIYVLANYLFPKDDHHMEATIQMLDGTPTDPATEG